MKDDQLKNDLQSAQDCFDDISTESFVSAFAATKCAEGSGHLSTLRHDIDALRAENARLRVALAPFCEKGSEGYCFDADVYKNACAALAGGGK